MGFCKEEIEGRLASGESLRSIALSLGITYQTLQYHRRLWGGQPLRRAYTSGENHASWRGGVFTDHWGYRMVLSPDHGKCSKYVPEHALIAEQKIGRKLNRNEVVHHINGVKFDNRPENLLVLTRSQHRKLHAQLESLAFQLVTTGIITFSFETGYQLAC